VFHDATVQASADAQFNSYVEYGQRMAELIAECRGQEKSKPREIETAPLAR